MLAFRAADGTLSGGRRWAFGVHAAPALAADRVYVPLEDGRVVALEVSDGAQVWERRLGGPPNDMLALDDRIYVGSDDNFFYCLLASNGEVAWRWRTGGDVIGVPVVDDAPRLLRVARQRAARAGSRVGVAALEACAARAPDAGTRARRPTCCWSAGWRRGSNAFAMKDGRRPARSPRRANWPRRPVHDRPSAACRRSCWSSRDVAKGTRVLALRRKSNPPMNTPLPVLPGAITHCEARNSRCVRRRRPSTAAPVQAPSGTRPAHVNAFIHSTVDPHRRRPV